jgi:hypothetical protein
MTHPPGHPTGPTGPGRTDTPGPADAALRPSTGPGIDPIGALPVDRLLDEADLIAAASDCGDGIGEPNEHSTPRLPRLGEQVRVAVHPPGSVNPSTLAALIKAAVKDHGGRI